MILAVLAYGIVIYCQAPTCGRKGFPMYLTSKALPADERLVALLELLRRAISICVVLVSLLASDVVLVVHVGGILLGLVVSTLAIPFVHA